MQKGASSIVVIDNGGKYHYDVAAAVGAIVVRQSGKLVFETQYSITRLEIRTHSS